MRETCDAATARHSGSRNGQGNQRAIATKGVSAANNQSAQAKDACGGSRTHAPYPEESSLAAEEEAKEDETKELRCSTRIVVEVKAVCTDLDIRCGQYTNKLALKPR